MVEIDNIITDEKIENYFERTKEAISIIKNGLPLKKSFIRRCFRLLLMIDCYFEDAKTFIDKGDYINAFASLNYAYGWIDAGARLGIFNVGDDDVRFTLAK